jgi:hypothetical protein
MEWNNRAGRPAQSANTVNPGAAPAHSGGGSRKREKKFSATHFAQAVLLFSTTVLVLAVIAYLMVGKVATRESKFVDGSKLQAVFLNGGQVYFGNIGGLNSEYLGLKNIYYLRVNQQVQPKPGEQQQQDISLVKLGCELHGPQDQMIINRDQVVFWENLKDDGQVAKAVAEYQKANPDGQKCDTNSQQTPSTDTNKAQ